MGARHEVEVAGRDAKFLRSDQRVLGNEYRVIAASRVVTLVRQSSDFDLADGWQKSHTVYV